MKTLSSYKQNSDNIIGKNNIKTKNYFNYFIILLIIGGYEFVVRFGGYSEFTISPTRIFAEFCFQVSDGTLLSNLGSSMIRVSLGFSAACLAGVSLAIFFRFFPLIGKFVYLILEFIRPVPPIAWIPFSILWVGIGNKSAIFIVFIGAFFPILINTHFGLTSIEKNKMFAAKSLGANKILILRMIIIPAALPSIFNGMKVSVGIAWTCVIASEMVGTKFGLGYAIQVNRLMLNYEAMCVNLTTIGFVGWMISKIIDFADLKINRWATIKYAPIRQ